MPKVHLNIMKVNNPGQLTVKQAHNNRTNTHEDFSHIDPTRTYLNHDLVNHSNADIKDLVFDRINEVSMQVGENIRKRKDAVIAYSVYLAYTHGAEEENQFSVEEWEEASVRWLQNYFGEENVVSAMVHLDESSPHIHATVVPITPDLRLCAKDFTGGREAMSALHQSYGREMAKEPFCMELCNQKVKAKHSSIQQYYDEINAVDELVLPEKEREETLEAYQERVYDFCRKTEMRRLSDKKYLELQIMQLQSEIRNLRVDYKQAINLHQYLSRILGTKENADKELLNLYNIEHFPRELLNQLFDRFQKNYTIDGNLVHQKEERSINHYNG